MAKSEGHLAGGAPYFINFKIDETFASDGVPAKMAATTGGIEPVTTTSAAVAIGLGVGTATYSTTQGDVEGILKVDVRPDLILNMLCSGSASTGALLTLLSNTSASAGGTTISDADVGSDDMDGGIVWRYPGESGEAGESRTITTHNSATSFVVTVPFSTAIAAGDEFLFLPWNWTGEGTAGNDGNGHITLTTALTQANAASASGAGCEVSVVDMRLRGRGNTEIMFRFRDHVHGADTI